MAAVISSGQDPHDFHCRNVFGARTDEDVAAIRHVAKQMFFTIVYGGGAGAVAHAIGLDVTTAEAVMKRVWGLYPGLRAWVDASAESARRTGSVWTVMGRQLAVAPDDAYKMSINFPVQSLTADMALAAMLALPSSVSLMMSVHDMIAVEAGKHGAEMASEALRMAMTRDNFVLSRVHMSVPYDVAVRTSFFWE